MTRQYDAQEALAMGLVNTVVPVDQLECFTAFTGQDDDADL